MTNHKISVLANAITDPEGKEKSLSESIQQCWRDGDSVNSQDAYDVFVSVITGTDSDFGESCVNQMAMILNAATGAAAVSLDGEFKKLMDKAAEDKANGMSKAYYAGVCFDV